MPGSAPQQPDIYKWQVFDRLGNLLLDELEPSACWFVGKHAMPHGSLCIPWDHVRSMKWVPRGLYVDKPPTYGAVAGEGERVVFFRKRRFTHYLGTQEYSDPRTLLAFGVESIADPEDRRIQFVSARGLPLEGVIG